MLRSWSELRPSKRVSLCPYQGLAERAEPKSTFLDLGAMAACDHLGINRNHHDHEDAVGGQVNKVGILGRQVIQTPEG